MACSVGSVGGMQPSSVRVTRIKTGSGPLTSPLPSRTLPGSKGMGPTRGGGGIGGRSSSSEFLGSGARAPAIRAPRRQRRTLSFPRLPRRKRSGRPSPARWWRALDQPLLLLLRLSPPRAAGFSPPPSAVRAAVDAAGGAVPEASAFQLRGILTTRLLGKSAVLRV